MIIIQIRLIFRKRSNSIIANSLFILTINGYFSSKWKVRIDLYERQISKSL